MTLEEIAEYNRGYQDALRRRGYNDGTTNTQGSLVILRLVFREHSGTYAQGYSDGSFHSGRLPLNIERVAVQ
jgi:hypothetical protein